MSEDFDKTMALLAPSPIEVKVERGETDKKEFVFYQSFRIGRDEQCQVRLKGHMVSRFHLDVFYNDGKWWIQDLHSTNGTYVGGKRLDRKLLADGARIELGVSGPILVLEVAQPKAAPVSPSDGDPSLTRYIKHYFEPFSTGPAGEHTMMLRRAFQHVRKKQSRKYWVIIALVSLIGLGAAWYAKYKHDQLNKQQALASAIFYEMKDLELTLAHLEKTVAATGDTQTKAEIAKYRDKRKGLEESYDRFIDELGVYSNKMSEDERLIFRLARVFGECEVGIPPGFVAEVRNYINKWRSTDRLTRALARAQEHAYAAKIVATLLANDMPPQFFYLALQESDFDINRCGPPTRYGIAKGLWQFIPATAIDYGLRTGPLVRIRQPDPLDERHHFEKSTVAAAKYLNYIYNTEAQASGLLVVASYNWGEGNVRKLILKMPENPRDRNFWRFLANYKTNLPPQTYDYVFYIISAAVIGENPRLFGFDFDNPLSAFVNHNRASTDGQ